jgi:GNAT superfamily N-acetyltransferase
MEIKQHTRYTGNLNWVSPRSADLSLSTRPLSAQTWDPFAGLVERHNGIFGGCWCMGFHGGQNPWGMSSLERREAKRERVFGGTAHAGLVFDEDRCIGWCQFGAPHELSRIKNKKAYDAGLTAHPEWRITCFFVDRQYRRQGVAILALQQALAEIYQLGGGVVEAYPEDTGDKKVPTMALHAGTLKMFEKAGFARERAIGKNKWVVRYTVQKT